MEQPSVPIGVRAPLSGTAPGPRRSWPSRGRIVPLTGCANGRRRARAQRRGTLVTTVGSRTWPAAARRPIA